MIELLLNRANAAEIPLMREQAEKLEAYHHMLTETNARFNLTRVPDDPAEAVDRNYLDCLTPLRGEMPNIQRAIDVGSGAGFPGIPLSICLPDTRFTLLDSLGKRVEFLNSVIDTLHLNAEAIHLRAEDAARKPELREHFDLATARAVAPLNLLSEYLLPFVRTGGKMLAYKGPTADAELEQAANALQILGGKHIRTDSAPIPGRDWDHKLVWIEKQTPTPDKYPRKAGKPEKSPL